MFVLCLFLLGIARGSGYLYATKTWPISIHQPLLDQQSRSIFPLVIIFVNFWEEILIYLKRNAGPNKNFAIMKYITWTNYEQMPHIQNLQRNITSYVILPITQNQKCNGNVLLMEISRTCHIWLMHKRSIINQTIYECKSFWSAFLSHSELYKSGPQTERKEL